MASSLEHDFLSATQGSSRLHARATELLPGGVSGSGKSMKPYPLYVRSASGSRIVDVDDRSYVDLLMGGGAAITGHANPLVWNAIQEAWTRYGSVPVVTSELELALADAIRQHLTGAEVVRFTNTGSEATAACVRLARAVTGRRLVAKFEGGFHGGGDALLVSGVRAGAGTDDSPESCVDSAGLPTSVSADTVVLPFNDSAAVERTLDRLGAQIAAVVIEPVAQFHMGCIPAEPSFLASVREATTKHGILLVFDEVVTGFRVALGGAAEIYGVVPDLRALGKAIGGGMPIGAFCGARTLLDPLVSENPEQRVFQSGTFTGNPLSVAAGLATLRWLSSSDALRTMNELGERTQANIASAAQQYGLAVQVTGLGSLFQVHFASSPIRNKRDTMRADSQLQRLFSLGVISKGVYWPPHHPALLSTAHTAADMDVVDEAVDAVFRTIAEGA